MIKTDCTQSSEKYSLYFILFYLNKFEVNPKLILHSTHSNQTSLLYIFQIFATEKCLSGSASRTMAAMSLGFIVMVTPWTIQEVVAACTGSKVS